jgi:hypothetical protein
MTAPTTAAQIAVRVTEPVRGRLITPLAPILAPRRVLWCFGKCSRYTWQKWLRKKDGHRYFYCVHCGFKSLHLMVIPEGEELNTEAL